MLATLIGQLRDFALAEDVLQDAVVAALRHWPDDGVPALPRAWLLRVARRKAIDRFRREANFAAKRDHQEALGLDGCLVLFSECLASPLDELAHEGSSLGLGEGHKENRH